MPPISVMMKPASGLCNMECKYCFYCDETKKRKQESYGFMTEETLKNVIRKTILWAEGAVSYAFQGGEPTLRGLDFFEKVIFYQKKYNKNHVKVYNALQTNGLNLNAEWSAFFKNNNFLIGVSVDGVQKTHDAFRSDKAGKRTYHRITDNIKLLEQYQVPYNILTVVNREVAENIKEIYMDYKTKGWKYQQYILCLEPLGEKVGKEEYAVTPRIYGEFLIQLFDHWYQDWISGTQPYIRQFENYVGILLGYSAECCDQRGICGVQNVVEADGSVYPCDFYMLDEYKLGNFNECRLDTIQEKRKQMGFIERSLVLTEKCRNCVYFRICKGGCQRHRIWNAREEGYENCFCESYRMFFDVCYDRLIKVSVSNGF